MKDSKALYEKRKMKYEKLLVKFTKMADLISNLRLAAFILGVLGAIALIIFRLYYLCAAEAIVSTTIFIWLVTKHGKLLEFKKYASLLVKINENSLKRLTGEWRTFSDNGEEFKDENHSFSYDLDLFGESSFFQMINTASTFLGRIALKDCLTELPESKKDIVKRQGAIKELASKLKWRQRFEAEGMTASSGRQDPSDLIAWSGEKMESCRKPWFIAGIRILPAITVFLLISAYIFNLLPKYWAAATLVVQFILLLYKRKQRDSVFSRAAKYKNDIKSYYKMLQMIEKETFKSELLCELKALIGSKKGIRASRQIDKLSKIIDSTSQRYNIFYWIFNLITLWDYQNLIALESWKAESADSIKQWLDVIAQTETLNSLAILKYDHPEWAMPVLEEDKTLYEATDMGHPLLNDSGVHNDLSAAMPVKALLVTGSNMSGKSTFLRTAGINLVLAYSGAPACAKAFKASVMEIYTCMRVSDNMGKSISSFYAELLRIKTIVKAAAEKKKIFFLLDEIFKGTNSIDRHTGAKVLIERLVKTDSIGMVSTHDLELCTMENTNNMIRNYHFREYYENGEIRFDYKLRSGASTTRNAIYLMKMAGIEINE